VELLPEISSVILKGNTSGKSYYLIGRKSPNLYHVIVVVVVVLQGC